METRVHISLEVSDLEASLKFYSKLFQQVPTKVRDDYANFRLSSPQLHLALVHNPHRSLEPSVEQGASRHFGVELFSKDRLDSWLNATRKAGISTRIEEDVTCCYAKADKFWAQDPDGHGWEFWVLSAEADLMQNTEAATKTTSPCCAPGQC